MVRLRSPTEVGRVKLNGYAGKLVEYFDEICKPNLVFFQSISFAAIPH